MERKRLTLKQQIFISEYLIHKNAARAARIAGYSLKTARSIGAENLTKPYIWTEIEKGLRLQLEKSHITDDDFREYLKNLDGCFPGKLRVLELYGKSLGLFEKKIKPTRLEFSALDLLSTSK